MTSAQLARVVKDVLIPEIKKHGFERIPGPWFSFARQVPRGHQLVHIERPIGMSGFTVTLQELGIDGSRRGCHLEDFEGLRYYAVDSMTVGEIQRCTQQAAEHFWKYALQWFDDPEFNTPATRAVEERVRFLDYARQIQHGRELFKRGDYVAALEAFGAAELIQPLDPTTQKFCDVAMKRRPAMGR